MTNRFVDFVSDSNFLDCVKWVCDSYPKGESKVDIKWMKRNTIDPFKQVFDIINTNINVETWIIKEKFRQEDKTINNTIGEFHQKLLGKVAGWVDLGTGDQTQVDLRKRDNSVFIELKNKSNTVNADSKSKVREKLERAVSSYPKAIGYWAYILGTGGKSGEDIWKYKGKINPRIKRIWGKNVYQLVTGDPDALFKVWKALPTAIKEVLKNGNTLSPSEAGKLLEFFASSFDRSSLLAQLRLTSP